MTTWFTADTHFGHENIIRYCSRPYDRVGQMDFDLARRWNEVVGDDDLVYHLGDFAMGKPDRWPAYRAELRGRIILVRGNHDRYLERVADAMRYEEVLINAVVEVEGVRCWLNHYPVASHDERYLKRPTAPGPYDLALCGHVHDNWRVRDGVVNAGVDVWGFAPVRLEQLLAARDGDG
ncbi:MAG: metallophosphoesterase family protein [Vulcanimicrobiaceae bacterium]